MTEKDLNQLAGRHISEEQVERQLKDIAAGFPFLKLKAPASVDNGIESLSKKGRKDFRNLWKDFLKEGHTVVKFVPASGAASRMFKNMFAFLNADYDEPATDFEQEYFDHIKDFAFYKSLNKKCKQNEGQSVKELKKSGEYKSIVENMLLGKGLNYGNLPKGLIEFHQYDKDSRTPLEEHLAEAALYTSSGGVANVHFTVSHDHLELFREKVEEVLPVYEKVFDSKINVSFSEQKASTDTIAANLDNTPFRNEDGSLLFRPGGHGALIENLNDIDADVIFIKNIDNVVPDSMKHDTVVYKQVLGGILISLQKEIFGYLEQLDQGNYSRKELDEMAFFLENMLSCHREDMDKMGDGELKDYVFGKLNRPIRVCGVVKNVGEPGGGPFIVYNTDGTTSLQILESSQIDPANEQYQKMFSNGTHFNPVDIVCATKDYKGNSFNLVDYVDHSTGFISRKSSNGKELKALELPGLWNGAMSNWNTMFVEVPLTTFNPVKTVNDLLRKEHQ